MVGVPVSDARSSFQVSAWIHRFAWALHLAGPAERLAITQNGGSRLRSSAQNAYGGRRIAATRDERPQCGDVKGGVEREPDCVEHIHAGPLQLVEAPLDNAVRNRTLDERAKAGRDRRSCRRDHDRSSAARRRRLRRSDFFELERKARRELS